MKKKCSSCGESKPTNEFYNHRNTKDSFTCIQVISMLANAMKHNATRKELIQFANWILK